ncbi:MAG: hypothetical protein NC177_03230 [Ruminococcus flavefaciens]|nr:hypothetical protein [Ruminococcus flavefaciens]
MSIKFKGINEMIFIFFWFIFSFSYIINASLLGSLSVFKMMYKLEVVAFGGVLALLFLVHSRIKLKKIILASMFLVSCLIIAKVTGKIVYMVFILFVANSECTSFKRIIKTTIISVTLATLLVIVSCKLGFIPDYIFIREEGLQAHSLGFTYYYTVSTYAMFVSILYIYYKKNVSWIELSAIVLLSYAIYKTCTTRLPFVILLLALCLYVLLNKFDIIKNINCKIIRIYSLVAFPIACITCVVAAVLYNPSNPVFYKLNEILNHRLSLSHAAFARYSVKLFGQYVEMQGNTYGKVQTNYFFIDSGYILSVVEYGIVATVILLALYSFIYYYSCKTNNKRLFVWITMVLIFNVVNGCWFAFVYNPVFFVLMHMDKYSITELLSSIMRNKEVDKVIKKLNIAEEI